MSTNGEQFNQEQPTGTPQEKKSLLPNFFNRKDKTAGRRPPQQPVTPPDRQAFPLPSSSSPKPPESATSFPYTQEANSQPERTRQIPGQHIMSEQKALTYYFEAYEGRQVQPILTDKFIEKSKAQYNNPAWLARELVQNFVDHNPTNPGTLDGVTIRAIPQQTGEVQFVIEANWPIPKMTGLTSPHSDKPEGQNTAGGNGIGLKQTALIYLRDLGVDKFEIQGGGGWAIDYELIKAEEVNKKWREQAQAVPVQPIEDNWLIADIKQAPPTGKCAYVLSTDNPTVIAALKDLPNIGVSRENNYLRHPNYQNEYGSITWLPLPEDNTDEKTMPQGRLFINGQVMNFKNQGNTAQDYWRGPELATIQLNNVNYAMSIDRPPLLPFQLDMYTNDLINAMSKQDLMEQLQQSKQIWTNIVDKESTYSTSKLGCFILIEKMVDKLSKRPEGYTKADYKQLFPEDNYLAYEDGIDQKDLEQLREQGYTICPPYFEKIGMPKAGSKIEKKFEIKKIDDAEYEKKQIEFAKRIGQRVDYQDFADVGTPQQFLAAIAERCKTSNITITQVPDNPRHIRLTHNNRLTEADLFDSLTPKRSASAGRKMLHFMRGLIQHGLEEKILTAGMQVEGKYIIGYELSQREKENLYTTTATESKMDEGHYLEVEVSPDSLPLFEQFLLGQTPLPQESEYIHPPQPPTTSRETTAKPASPTTTEAKPTQVSQGEAPPSQSSETPSKKEAAQQRDWLQKPPEESPQAPPMETPQPQASSPEQQRRLQQIQQRTQQLQSELRTVMTKKTEEDQKPAQTTEDLQRKRELLQKRKEIIQNLTRLKEQEKDEQKSPEEKAKEAQEKREQINKTINSLGEETTPEKRNESITQISEYLDNLLQQDPQNEELRRKAEEARKIIDEIENQSTLEGKNAAVKKLLAEINAIPVQQPQAPETKKPRVIGKESKLTEEDQRRVEQLENDLPGIAKIVKQLNEAIPHAEKGVNTQSEIQKYIEWRNSGEFYGKLATESGYLSGKHLLELVAENNQADIAVAVDMRNKSQGEQQMGRLQSILKGIVGRLGAEGHDINDFEIEYTPTEEQLSQLGLLKIFAEITTGMPIANDLFVYKGTGSKGINIAKKAIGLHEELFNVSFREALSTFDHEIAHNNPESMQHDVPFMHAMQSIFVTQLEKLLAISEKLTNEQPLNEQELVLLDIQNQWERLRQKRTP